MAVSPRSAFTIFHRNGPTLLRRRWNVETGHHEDDRQNHCRRLPHPNNQETIMIKTSIRLAASALYLMSSAAFPASNAPGTTKNIVLVHGAFADGSGWSAVSAILQKDGYKTFIVQPPETSLEDDVAATRRVLDALDGPAVLVGHSYGGIIITGAGDNPKVKSLVYVAAFQPDVGESLASLGAKMPAASTAVRPSPDGFLFLDQ